MIGAPVITDVREAHRFDEPALARYLHERLPGFDGPLEVRQFEGGQSNPTFVLRTGDMRYVMRKQPPGELLPSAHQVDREHRVMKALETSEVPVPGMRHLCEDISVIGTKFYVMEMIEGRVFADPGPPALTPAERNSIYREMIEVLAKLHAVDYSAVGLDDFGRPGNYCNRQISRWSRQYEASKTQDIPEMDQLMAWLPEHTPDHDETTVVHGDFRIGNVIIHPTEPRIVAVLDWELSTLGHPVADLGYLCMEYHADAVDGTSIRHLDLASMGIPTEDEQIARYTELTGRDVREHWTFYLAYNLFRSAAIVQGVYKRGVDGNASSDTALGYKDTSRHLAEQGWAVVQSR